MLPISLTLQVEKAPSLTLGLDNTDLDLSIGTAINVTQLEGDKYEGPYAVTPTGEAQVLETIAKTMEGNITIEPIPQNYGMITWNGSVLTVS